MRLLTIFASMLMLVFAQSHGAHAECQSSEFACAAGGHCITIAWRCDRGSDCPDGSDEENCPSVTCADNFFKCNNGRCIPNRWICDDNDDCEDGSDETEAVCFEQPCDGFRCNGTGQCIPDGWRCDGAKDCKYQDDEQNCTATCDDDEFKCSDGQCISVRWQCDHREDCDDGSDEKDCIKPDEEECNGIGQRKCDNGECMNESWFCDGETDCTDGSDEKNCSEQFAKSTCEPHEFQCALPLNTPECVNWSWKCDSFPDCSNGSDEQDCDHLTCRTDERKCDQNYCIKEIFFCDGEEDCTDGSDETNCTFITLAPELCEASEFDCNGDGSQCISNVNICDGEKNCDNGADEALEQQCPPHSEDVCTTNNGGCLQMCIPTLSEPSKRRCECFSGFELEGSDCVDINECKLPGTCSQLCNNTKGSYKCTCMEGYELTNHRHCKAKGGKRPMLILSSRNELRSYHLDTFHYTLLLDEQVSAVAIDFNIRTQTVFWTDVNAGKVFSANLATNNVSTIISEDINMPDGIAVDWIHENLYLADTGNNRIEVARLDGSHRKILITEELDEPRSLVLDPHNGWMYWTDWGNSPKIEKCGMNGKYRKVIVQQQITWPNGLTIDYVGQRLYWVDAKLRTIGSTDLNGEDYNLVLTDHKNLGHPFAITVFEDYLYWTDWMTNAVHRVSKFGKDDTERKHDVTTIAPNLKSPMDIHVYHIYRQPTTQNQCENGKCSHLCLPMPKLNNGVAPRYECACPKGWKLITSTVCKPDGYEPGVTTEVTPHVDSMPHVDSTEGTKTNETITQTLEKEEKEEGNGVITVIVVVVLLVCGLFIGVVVFVLVRRHKQKNVMSMNFDNPVYRKTTTDDQLIMEKNSSTPRDQSLQPLNTEAEVV